MTGEEGDDDIHGWVLSGKEGGDVKSEELASGNSQRMKIRG